MPTPCNCDTFTSDVTISNTTAPQLVILGGATASLRLFPQGGGATSSVEAFSTDDPTLASYSRLRLTVDGTTGWLIADAAGSATAMPVALQVGGAERPRVTTAGNVGIGTSNPTQLLTVGGTISYKSGSSGAVGLVDDDNHAIRSNGVGAQVFANGWGHAAQGWIFRDDFNAVDRVVIQSNGLVGLGTDSPTQLLHLQGGSLYINGGSILASGDVTTGVGAYFAGSKKVADAAGCYYA